MIGPDNFPTHISVHLMIPNQDSPHDLTRHRKCELVKVSPKFMWKDGKDGAAHTWAGLPEKGITWALHFSSLKSKTLDHYIIILGQSQIVRPYECWQIRCILVGRRYMRSNLWNMKVELLALSWCIRFYYSAAVLLSGITVLDVSIPKDALNEYISAESNLLCIWNKSRQFLLD